MADHRACLFAHSLQTLIMAVEYTTSSKLAISHGIKGAIYGNAGTGKTMLAATAPRPFMISTENGALSLSRANITRVWGADRPDITYDIGTGVVRTLADFKQCYNDVTNPNGWIWQNTSTIWIDSATEIVEQILKAAHEENKDGRAAFGDMYDEAIVLFKKFRDLEGKHVFNIFEQGFSSDTLLIGPSLPGKQLDRKLPYTFDLLLGMMVGEVEQNGVKQKVRWLRTESDNKYYAKDRSGGLNPAGELPHIGHIINKAISAQ